MNNICLEYMPLSWVYHYFPGTMAIDRKRFWSNQKLLSVLEETGFVADIRTDIIFKRFDLEKMIKEAENRDMSQLNLISDAEYNKGLKKILKDRESADSYLGEFAGLRCVAYKKI